MAGILDGLGNLGLSSLSSLDIYDKKSTKTAVKEVEIKEKKEEAPPREEDYLFEKTITCPVCQQSFPSLSVRMGKIRKVGMDQDLRPLYEPFDASKYDPISCPYCGYTDFAKTFNIVSDFQVGEIKDKITRSFVPMLDFPAVYDYERAFRHYQMALATAIVTRAKASQKAYICLKTGWILRGQAESMDPTVENYRNKVSALKAKEKEFLSNALEGFLEARKKEAFPIADMDEVTLDFLIGALSLKEGRLDVASQMVAKVLDSKAVNQRVKDKAREMKDMILETIRARKQDGV